MATSPLRPFAGVLFDLDDTLNDRSASWRVFVHVLLYRYQDRLNGPDAAEMHRLILAADRNGYRPKDEFFGELCEQMPWIDGTSPVELEAFWREHFAACMVERAEARSLLGDMRSAGLRIAIVTNGQTQMQLAKVKSLGLQPLVDAVVISEAVGAKKPHPHIFHEALRRISCASERVLFVGDNPALDVVGAASLGMRTAWLMPGREWPADLVAANYSLLSLSELRPILGLTT
jgi:putative hydrolase of the HAD superfamily